MRPCLVRKRGLPFSTLSWKICQARQDLILPDADELELDLRKDLHPISLCKHAMTDLSSALRSLCLLQAVATHGPSDFDGISKQIKASDLAREASINDQQLEPHTLSSTYVQLLEEEADNGPHDAQADVQKVNGGLSMATLEDAAPYYPLVSRLIPKLYEQYKAQAIQEIKSEEQKYDRLRKELDELRQQALAESKPSTNQTPAPRPSSSDKAKIGSILNDEDGAPDASPRPSPIQPPRSGQSLPPMQRPPMAQSVHQPIAPSPGPSDPARFNNRQSGSPVILPPPGVLPRLNPSTSATVQPASAVSSPPRQQEPTSEQQGKSSAQLPPPPNSGLQDRRVPTWLEHPPWTSTSYQPQASSYSTQARTHVAPNQHGAPGGVHLPPFAVGQSRLQQAQQQQQQQAGGRRPSGLQTLQTRPSQLAGQAGTPRQSLTGGHSTPITSAKASPALANILNAPPSAHFSPGSSTGWRGPLGPEKPRPRSISPPSDREPSPQRPAAKRGGRRGKPGALHLGPDANQGSARRGSKTPSAPATATSQGRTRSQSLASFADDASIVSGTKGIKTRGSTPTPGDRPSIRHTRSGPSISTNTKRKRGDSDTDSFVTAEGPLSPALPLQPPHQPPTTIVAQRNFQRMTNPLMDNITSHKLGSIFATPVSAKTPGYYDTIRRPTDLKTIRGQIAQGSRAVAAATASAPSAGGAGSPGAEAADTGATIALPYSEELEPPKAIVNAAQLEQELMRMFANAVMFNEGNDGVVEDTREMFEDVERIMADFRATEVGGGADGEIDDGSGSAAKRRRV